MMIAFSHATVPSFYRRVSTTYGMGNPMRSMMQKALGNPMVQQAGNRLREAMEKASMPLHTRVYHELGEPLYVGNKSPVWRKQLKDEFNYRAMNDDDKFASYKYRNWKDELSSEQEEQYRDDMIAYERSYIAHKINPTNNDLRQELLRQTERMKEIIQHTTPTRTQRLRRMFFTE